MERNTTAYQLNILRDTQMVQRRLLEKQFPYIDWARMPFSSYGDFFRLRGILDDCGAVWTNGYKRSNDEAESTRKYLKDYSGNGRDIELFNFGWAEDSGYGQYLFNWSRDWSVNNSGKAGMSTVKSKDRVSFHVTDEYEYSVVGIYRYTTYTAKMLTVRVTGMRVGETAAISFNEGSGDVVQTRIDSDGILKVMIKDTIRALVITVKNITDKSDRNIVIEQIPEYRGAIVGDGIDDYGQCVKDFALPDDYTVIAMREILNGGNAGIINKTRAISQGAFIFEYAGSQSYSYGDNYSGLSAPKLFSYQTKASYNGTALTTGTGTDTADDKLLIFRLRDGVSNYISAALYSFGIFTRTLTEEELRIVENCMYAEWIAMTGKLEDIEYYDILDSRFRSNEEDSDKRNKWVGRLGKLHMTLNNYAYSRMSGWNGYPFSAFNTLAYAAVSDSTENKAKITKVDGNGWIFYLSANDTIRTKDWKIKVHNPFGKNLYLIYINKGEQVKQIPLNEGINIIPPATEEFTNVAFNMNAFSIGEYIEVEQLPLYGGALVSDGVDDYAVSDEVIDEEIGGFVCHAEVIGSSYCFFSGPGFNTSFPNSIGMRSDANGLIHLGQPEKSEQPNSNGIYAFSKTPLAPERSLSIDRATNEYGAWALYQLRLIKTQPTETQLEAIKWQCRKEHDDYLIHMGWKEVE